MNTNPSGALDFDAYIKNSDFKRSIDEMKSSIQSFDSKVEKSFTNVDNVAKRVGGALAGYFTVGALAGISKELINVRGQFQMFEAVLTNSLGSQGEAVEALDMLAKKAASTPYQLNTLTGAFVKLVNQGFKPTESEITKLGDLTASVGKDFDQLAEALIDAQTGEFERLKEFGIKASKAGDQITFAFKGQKTIVDNTADSIRQYVLSLGDMQGVKGSMEAISKTLVGQVSNLQDAITSMLNEIGGNSEGVLSGAVGAAKGLVENYELVGKAVAALVVTFGTYKAATVLVTVANTAAANAAAGLTIAQQIQMKATLLATSAQNVLNKTMLANPYVAVATAIAAIVGGLILFRNKSDEVTAAQEKFKETSTESAAEIAVLFEQLKKTTKGTDERKLAIQKLNEKYPEYMKNINLEKAGLQDIEKAQRAVTDAVLARMATEGKTEDMKRIQESRLNIFKQLQEAGLNEKDIAEIKKYVEEPAKLTYEIDKATGRMMPKQTFKSWGQDVDLMIQNLTALQQQADQVNNQWDQLIDTFNSSQQLKTQAPATDDKGGDKAKRKIDDEISYRKEQYELYAKWVRAYGQKAADEQFSTLLQSGKSMKEYLEKEIQKLEARKEALSKQDKQNLEALKGTYIDYKTPDPVAEIQQMDSKGYQKNLETKLSLNKNFKQQEIRLAELTNEKLKDLSTDELRTWVKLAEYKLASLDIQSNAYQELATRIQLVNGIIAGDEMQNSAESFSQWAGLASQAINELSASIGGLDSETADLINQLGGLADGIGAISSGMASGNSEDMISGIISSSGSYYTTALDTAKKWWSVLDGSYQKEQDAQKAEEQRLQTLEDISRAYQEIGYELEYQLELNESLTTGRKLYADSKAISDNIKRNTQELKEMTFTNTKGGSFDYNYLMFITQARTETEAIQKALSSGLIKEDEAEKAMQFATAIEDGVKSLEQLKMEYAEYITGTSINSLVDQIREMFDQGTISAEDFANKFKDLMRQAMLQSFQMKALEGPLTKWFEDFSKGAGSGSVYWMDYMRNQWNEITGNAVSAWEDMQGLLPEWFGTGTMTGTGADLTGAIKGVTEETASIVAGQMNAIRLNQAIGLDVMREQLIALSQIRENTYRLLSIESTLKSVYRALSSNSSSGTRSNGIMF